jgi:hypothetical protein
MMDGEGLKAREAELLENLNYFLLRYDHLVKHGYRKQVLNGDIEQTLTDLAKVRAKLRERGI